MTITGNIYQGMCLTRLRVSSELVYVLRHYDGSLKVDLELSRDTQISNNFFIRLGIRPIFATTTIPRAEIGSGLNQMRYIVRPYYRLAPGLTAFLEFEHEQYYGPLKNIRQNVGESTSENTLSLGVSLLL